MTKIEKKVLNKKQTNEQKRIAEMKIRYIEYYRDLPVQKYAALYIGRDQETIINWRKADLEFSNKVDQARAEWVKKKASKAKVEFALERLEKSIFKESKEVEVVLPKPILNLESVNVHTDDSNK